MYDYYYLQIHEKIYRYKGVLGMHLQFQIFKSASSVITSNEDSTSNLPLLSSLILSRFLIICPVLDSFMSGTFYFSQTR